MGAELEEEVGGVDEEEDDGCAVGLGSELVMFLFFWFMGQGDKYQLGVALCVLGGVGLAGADVCDHVVEDGGDDEGGDAEGEEGGGGLRDGDVEVLLDAVEASGEEGHAQNK